MNAQAVAMCHVLCGACEWAQAVSAAGLEATLQQPETAAAAS